MNIIQIPAFTDNYFWLMFEDNNKSAVVVDPGDSAPVIKSLMDNNLELTKARLIFIKSISIVITNGLTVLGISAPKSM